MSRDERWLNLELKDGFDFNPCLGTHGNVKKSTTVVIPLLINPFG